MRLKIGCDIDGVVTNQIPAFLEIIKKRFGIEKKYEDVADYSFAISFGLPPQSDKVIIDDFNKEWLLKLEPMADAKEKISDILIGFDFILMTSRQNQSDTLEWLLEKGISYTSIEFISNKNKTQLCIDKGIEIIIEDCGEVALQAAESGIECVLFNAPWNTKFWHEKIHKCNNWNEIFHKIKSIRGKPLIGKSMLERLK